MLFFPTTRVRAVWTLLERLFAVLVVVALAIGIFVIVDGDVRVIISLLSALILAMAAMLLRGTIEWWRKVQLSLEIQRLIAAKLAANEGKHQTGITLGEAGGRGAKLRVTGGEDLISFRDGRDETRVRIQSGFISAYRSSTAIPEHYAITGTVLTATQEQPVPITLSLLRLLRMVLTEEIRV